ncbi:MAG: S-layer homology domain-containing protein [Acidobacteria bacterium]|nr:S-layer homology domain-containing protein [Acidobacteriota bacterium]
MPSAPRHPEFIYPVVSNDLQSTALPLQIERGWRYLQADDLRSAEREFATALKTAPRSQSAQAALGYLELARDDSTNAVTYFDRALEGDVAYVPALVGRGQALLEMGRDGEALSSFESALKVEPDLSGLQGRVDVLRFRAVQENLARAKEATDLSRWDTARAAYEQAIAASPDSAFLYRDLGVVERRAGRLDVALTQVRKAIELDANDARAHHVLAEVLDEQGDAAAALVAYKKAHAIDSLEVTAETLARARERAAVARLPAEYRAIPTVPALSRGELAALVGVRLESLVSAVRPQQIVITDVRGHWAQPWITAVVRAGVMETLPNYRFEPGARVRRGDLAHLVTQALALIAARKPGIAERWKGAQLSIADLPPQHLSYPAVSQAVASGVMRLLPDGTFQLLRPVTGAEAVEIVGRLEALAEP